MAVNSSLSHVGGITSTRRLFDELRAAVEQFDENHIIDDMGTSELEDENWRLIAAYLIVVKPFEKASKTLGGDTYPAACTVVPMLDQVIQTELRPQMLNPVISSCSRISRSCPTRWSRRS